LHLCRKMGTKIDIHCAGYHNIYTRADNEGKKRARIRWCFSSILLNKNLKRCLELFKNIKQEFWTWKHKFCWRFKNEKTYIIDKHNFNDILPLEKYIFLIISKAFSPSLQKKIVFFLFCLSFVSSVHNFNYNIFCSSI
jgi:hypothetical protein